MRSASAATDAVLLFFLILICNLETHMVCTLYLQKSFDDKMILFHPLASCGESCCRCRRRTDARYPLILIWWFKVFIVFVYVLSDPGRHHGQRHRHVEHRQRQAGSGRLQNQVSESFFTFLHFCLSCEIFNIKSTLITHTQSITINCWRQLKVLWWSGSSPDSSRTPSAGCCGKCSRWINWLHPLQTLQNQAAAKNDVS